MGRKSIHNVDFKIMDEVIKETTKYGIACISTKELARRIHISEPVIFAHFGTKQNLMDRTFEYAWKQIPERAIFPKASDQVNDPEVYNLYIARFQELLKYPKVLIFGDAYYHSYFYNKVFADRVMSGLVNQLVPIFASYQTGRDEETRRMMVTRYLENVTSDMAQIARGVVPDTPENIRIAFGTLLFGSYGLLTDHKNI